MSVDFSFDLPRVECRDTGGLCSGIASLFQCFNNLAPACRECIRFFLADTLDPEATTIPLDAKAKLL